MCGQLYLASNQITRFIDYYYLWKKSIDVLSFLVGDIDQGKVAPETTTFGWVWPVVHSISLQTFLIIDIPRKN